MRRQFAFIAALVLVACDQPPSRPIDICAQRVSPERLTTSDMAALVSFRARMRHSHDAPVEFTPLHRMNWAQRPLQIAFLDGTDRLQRIVIEVAAEWQVATIPLSRRGDHNTEIRMPFSVTRISRGSVVRPKRLLPVSRCSFSAELPARIPDRAFWPSHAMNWGAHSAHPTSINRRSPAYPGIRQSYTRTTVLTRIAGATRDRSRAFHQHDAAEVHQDLFELRHDVSNPRDGTSDGSRVESNVPLLAEDKRAYLFSLLVAAV